MAAYIISYDLLKPIQNYTQLHNAIKAYGTWARVNESFWVVVTPNSAVQIRDYLSGFIDGNDRLFVIKSGTEAAWKNVMCENTWLKDKL